MKKHFEKLAKKYFGGEGKSRIFSYKGGKKDDQFILQMHIRGRARGHAPNKV